MGVVVHEVCDTCHRTVTRRQGDPCPNCKIPSPVELPDQYDEYGLSPIFHWPYTAKGWQALGMAIGFSSLFFVWSIQKTFNKPSQETVPASTISHAALQWDAGSTGWVENGIIIEDSLVDHDSGIGFFTPAELTVDRTFTFPDESGTLMLEPAKVEATKESGLAEYGGDGVVVGGDHIEDDDFAFQVGDSAGEPLFSINGKGDLIVSGDLLVEDADGNRALSVRDILTQELVKDGK